MTVSRFRVTVLAPLIALMSCCTTPVISPVAPSLPDPSFCEPACDNLERMRCPGWEGSPGRDEVLGTADDVSCAEVCREFSRPETGVDLCPECVSRAGSCAEADACRGRCE